MMPINKEQIEKVASSNKEYIIGVLTQQSKEIEYAFIRIEGLLALVDKLKKQ